ncbi:MAG: type IV toxin-antitoxin system AbiEi family antitoxin [Saprospiraceae bacterium]
MTDQDLMQTTIKSIKNFLDIDFTWNEKGTKNGGHMYDGILKMVRENKELKYLIEIKQELRTHQFAQIETLKNRANLPFLLITKRLTPEIRMELRNRNIEYLEANGNMYINKNELLLVVDGQPPIRTENENTNRAFTKTGLKVIFHLLLIDDLINKPYRDIAAITKVALGNINYIFTGLKEMGFLLQLTKDQYKLTNKKELLDRWLTGFTEKLKPGLQQGKFAFATETAQKNWHEIKLQKGQTFWAGEPAGDLLTDHLRPEIFTIYTDEGPNDIIRNYKLIPKENGNVRIYQKFWNVPDADLKNIAPPLLVYADLITTTDKRCRETANMIYDKYIQPNL